MMCEVGTKRFWTNESVRLFAGDRDPIEVITERARALVFDAVERGWSGPPFDPFELADIQGVSVVPREDLYDARLVAGDAGASIEFNPTRPRGRVRFTVAHELAHTFFEDFGARDRYRSASEKAVTDEWQLELLCNRAAAEMLMPVGSFEKLESEPLNIEGLMDLRKELDVSTESLLLRVVHLTELPVALVATARTGSARAQSPFRVDYVADSRSWTSRLRRGMQRSGRSVLSDCTAVGFTTKRAERWPHVGDVRVEAVGVAPYPGQLLPRVLALLIPESQDAPPYPR